MIDELLNNIVKNEKKSNLKKQWKFQRKLMCVGEREELKFHCQYGEWGGRGGDNQKDSIFCTNSF